MTGFELQTFGIGSDRSTNWATTTAQQILFVINLIEIVLKRQEEKEKRRGMAQLKAWKGLEIWSSE